MVAGINSWQQENFLHVSSLSEYNWTINNVKRIYRTTKSWKKLHE